MLLVAIWNNNNRVGSPDFRVTEDFANLENPWSNGLVDVQKMSYAIDTPHGGMIRSKFGSLLLLPDVACTDYIGVDVRYSDTNESDSILLYSGVSFVNNRTRTVLTFDLFSDPPTVEVTSEINYTGGTHSLISIFQGYCDSVLWTLNKDLATPDLFVDFKAGTGQLFADMLSDLCQTFGHYFIVDTPNKTIHLRSVSTAAGTPVLLSGFKFNPSKYSFSIPPSKVTIGDTTAYGDPYYFGGSIDLFDFGSSDNYPHAVLIRDLYTDNPEVFNFIMPLSYFAKEGLNFVTRNKITWVEDTVTFSGGATNVTFNMVILGVSFNMKKHEAVLSGRITT